MRFFLLLTMGLLFSSSVKGNHDEVEDFWSIEAQRLDWFHPWNQVLDWKPPYAEWFLGGKLNACYNCIDRHMHTKIRTKTALIWEGEEGDVRSFTYEDLYNEINRFSNVLKSKGIQKGDVVVIYLPMIPEAVIAMLSCARIGAIHNVVFAGFSAEALKGRIMDSEAKAVITADGGRRRGKIIPLKEITNLALKDSPSVKNVVVVKHVNQPINMQDGRDYWYDRLMQKAEKLCPVEEMDSEDPLFILYTSGSTGKPKGIVHATGGYMVAVSSTMNFMRNSKPADLFFSLGDIGWLSGHTAVVYGPLSNGDSHLIYEGAVDYPEKDRVWKLIEKYKVTSFSTSPTGIRTFMKWGDEWVRKWDLSSLRLLSSAGEPLNPEAWNWYYTQVGKKKCPILDSWGQTETGAAMISSVLNTSKPGSSGSPLPGMNIKIVDDKGNFSNKGHVVITTPWPSMLRGIYKDPQRYEETYWKKLNGSYCYFTGDEAQVDNEGDFYFMGRSDDVINISGHRLSTMELESAFTSYLDVVEAAVIDIPHEIKGSALIAFVTLKEGLAFEKKMEELLKDHISHEIGAIARPDRVIFTRDLPKTRTGKIMRRLLRDIALGKVLGDTTTLLDSSVIALIQKQYEELD